MPLRNKHKHVIGLHPGAGKSENRWPAERFASIANRLSEVGLRLSLAIRWRRVEVADAQVERVPHRLPSLVPAA